MMEIAQLLESALADNRSSLRQAAKLTVSRMDPETTVDELLGSDAGDAVRDLTLSELKEALTKLVETAGLRTVATSSPAEGVVDQSQEERIYRRILEALADGPLTIGKLAKGLDMDTTELRGYLSWMKRMGKVMSSGRARATRYSLIGDA